MLTIHFIIYVIKNVSTIFTNGQLLSITYYNVNKCLNVSLHATIFSNSITIKQYHCFYL